MIILIGKRENINVRATIVARLYYRQEFGYDVYKGIEVLRSSAAVLENGEVETAALENVLVETFKLCWAMNKADNYAMGITTPDFEQWLKTHSDFDFTDNIGSVMREAVKGFVAKIDQDNNVSDTYDEGADIAYYIEVIAIRLGIGYDRLNEWTTQTFMDVVRDCTEISEEDDGKFTQVYKMVPQEG